MMARRSKPEKRIPLPDPVYGDVKVAKFINRLMLSGKKSVAEHIFYQALTLVEAKTSDKPLDVFHNVLKKASPLVRVKSRRVGGSTYQVPIEVDDEMGEAIASRWIITFARKRSGRSMAERLAYELLDVHNGTGTTMKKRDETHRMAEANKAFAHYRY
jgi:small subunit ribosomal protein S7